MNELGFSTSPKSAIKIIGKLIVTYRDLTKINKSHTIALDRAASIQMKNMAKRVKGRKA